MGMFGSMHPVSGPDAVIELATTVLKMDQKNHNHAVGMATAIREAIISMTVAMAIVTCCQDPEKPIIAITDSEITGGDTEGHTPVELLESLTTGNPYKDEDWANLVEEFKAHWANVQSEEILKNMPNDFNVSDILGEI